jgi:tetratricopeptide (TPR) repeat protein
MTRHRAERDEEAMDQERNFYEILGVEVYATPQQIQASFQKKIDNINRSDRFNDLDTYAQVLKAYQVLSDDEKRKDYDHYLKVSYDLGIVSEAPNLPMHTEKKRATLRVTPAELQRRDEGFIEKVQQIVRKGQVNKVRIKYGDKVLLPAVPLSLFLAAEALTFVGAGLVRALVANVGIGTLLDVEFINDAEEHYNEGARHYQSGDLEEAISEYRQAISIDSNYAEAYLNLGVIYKIQGDLDGARGYFEKALSIDPHGVVGRSAKDNLRKIETMY